MKHIVRLFVVLASVVMLSSCMKDKEQEYTYSLEYATSVSSEENIEKIVEYIKSSCDGYFTTTHNYFGYSSVTNEKAYAEFCENCEKLDEKTILSYMEDGEIFKIYLLQSGVIISYCYWVGGEDAESVE